MPTSTERFFDRLASGESTSVLGSAKGTIRFDLTDGRRIDHWRVALNRGSATVTRSDEPADTVITSTRREFDEVADGNVNALTAALRGMLGIEGDPAVLVRFQRLFPAGEPKREAGSSARTVGRQRS
jgi:putative sterol carrier protein